jgi:hypothetical protein
MKNITFIFICLVGMHVTKSLAQVHYPPDSIPIKHNISIELIGESRRMESLYTKKGSIYSVNDSSLVFTPALDWFHKASTPTEIMLAKDIWNIQTREKGNIDFGTIIIGACAGSLIGGLIGRSNYKKCEPDPNVWLSCALDTGPSAKTLVGALVGLPIGVITGALASNLMKTNFLIKGNPNSYAAQRDKLKRLSITGQ